MKIHGFLLIAISAFLIIGVTSDSDVENEIVGKTSDEESKQDHGKDRKVNGNAAQRSAVRKHIFADYDKMNIPDDLAVKFGMTLMSIDIDQSRRTVEADIWFTMDWADSRLKWNKDEMGVSQIRIGPNELWKPDITLYNSRMNEGAIEQCKETEVILYNTGNLIWIPPCHISAKCDLKYNRGNVLAPVQDCSFLFGSWVYDGNIMDLNFVNQTDTGMDVSQLTKTEWRITRNLGELNKKFYPCCKEPYLSITYNFTLSRETEDENCEL